ncbi:hypothetical protein GCK32_016281 [Trichostrongylus colubriformis]|uniref:Aftiphilin clathrin-binding box domain-containing protein n=1 Tax=Trichostrongylus colubriformis TaxID=6319 RepID=A0AAN8FC88_TRICO
MDFEAPPPFAGALEEPPDSECDNPLTVDDEDDSIRELEIPTDIPCTSSTVSSPVPSPCPVKQKPLDSSTEEYYTVPAQESSDHHVNGLADTEEDVSTSSDVIVSNREKAELAEVALNEEDDFDDDFGDFAGIDTEIPQQKVAGMSFDLWLALRIVEDALALKFEWKGSEYGSNLFKTLRVDPNAVGRGTLPPLSSSTVLEPIPFTANGTTRRSVIISREEGAYGAKIVASDVPPSAVHNNCSAITSESPSIPQADFDWEASDLTNPTKAARPLRISCEKGD